MRFLLEDWNIEGCPKELARMKARESAAFSNQKNNYMIKREEPKDNYPSRAGPSPDLITVVTWKRKKKKKT